MGTSHDNSQSNLLSISEMSFKEEFKIEPKVLSNIKNEKQFA